MTTLPARRRRRRRILIGLGLTLLIALMVLDRHGGPLHHGGDEMSRYDGQRFDVTGVVAGHTLELAAPDGEAEVTRVRLWGVRLPEAERRRAEWAAAAARQRADELAAGRSVKLTLEPHRVRGDFGRVLAFVELPDGAMLNEVLLSEGLMVADDRWTHRHLERFALLERQARFDGRGVWGRP